MIFIVFILFTYNSRFILDRDSDSDSEEADNNFKRKRTVLEEKQFETQFKRQRRLDIKAIQFDWIFGKQRGAEFINALSRCK